MWVSGRQREIIAKGSQSSRLHPTINYCTQCSLLKIIAMEKDCFFTELKAACFIVISNHDYFVFGKGKYLYRYR